MIKQIQLRGISRSPSDRMTSDGGVDESLNIHLDGQESAPVLVPDDVTSQLGIPDGVLADMVFVHKMVQTEKIIYLSGNDVITSGTTILELQEGETLNDIASVGNTLVLTTSEDMYYLLYDHAESQYEFIGNTVPLPAMEITSQEVITAGEPINVTTRYTQAQPTQEMMFYEDWYSGNQYYDSTLSKLAGAVTRQEETDGWYNNSIFVRYAAKLYDGTYISSVPYLVSPESIGGLTGVEIEYNWDEGYEDDDVTIRNTETIDATYSYIRFKPFCQLIGFTAEDAKKWSNIIEKIEIYFSTQIPRNTSYFRLYNVQREYDYAHAVVEMGGASENEIQLLTDASVFYKVGSYDLLSETQINSLINGVTFDMISDTDLINNGEQLDPTKEEIRSSVIVPKSILAYNNRIIAYDSVKKFERGSKTLTSAAGKTHYDDAWVIRYYIQDAAGKGALLAHGTEGYAYITGPRAYGWITHPNPNCIRAAISNGDLYVEVEMKRHPWMNCSFGYVGKLPLTTYMETDEQRADINVTSKETLFVSDTSKLYVSGIDNPFSFPVAGVMSFGSRILGAAVATTALSQGQFGQFPLYVFTEDGIWAMETATDGTFVTSKALSRDVCVNPKSITSIDNAVIFVSEKGVMLLQGSSVTNISPNMNGRHYAINAYAEGAISNTDYAPLIPALKDEDAFMAFVRNATIAYDYAGNRIILINENENYQYVYKLDTATWHKTMHDIALIEPINSYPECLASGSAYEESTESEYKITIEIDPSSEIPDKAAAYLYDVTREFASEDNASEFLNGQPLIKIFNSEANRTSFNNKMSLAFDDLALLWEVTYEETKQKPWKAVIEVTDCSQSQLTEGEMRQLVMRTFPEYLTYESALSFIGGENAVEATFDSQEEAQLFISEAKEMLDPESVDTESDITESAKKTRIYNLSTVLDDTRTQNTELGCIITRPFDLDYADVKKVINDIRIRGVFAKGHAQYLLQGSDDGINFFNTRLKQKSWKLFRIIIVCSLDRHERISWIDVDYETRYTNRLR